MYNKWREGVEISVDGLQANKSHDKLITKDRYLICPACGQNKILYVRPDTKAERLAIFCRKCKFRSVVDIEHGQCYRSQAAPQSMTQRQYQKGQSL